MERKKGQRPDFDHHSLYIFIELLYYALNIRCQPKNNLSWNWDIASQGRCGTHKTLGQVLGTTKNEQGL